MSAILSGIWGYVIAAAFSALVASIGTGYIISNVKGREIAQLELKQSKAETVNVAASLSQLQGFISRMNTADTDYNSRLIAINDSLSGLRKGLANAKTSLPVDCKPDISRVRFLTDSIAATNKAATPAK